MLPPYETGPDAIRRLIEEAAEVTPEPDRSLLDAQVSPAPPFFDVLPAGRSEWAHIAAEGASCSVDYVALPLLAAAGSLIGNARWGQPWAGWCEPPALFAGLIGRPSSGKSPGLDTVTGLLAQQEMALNEDWEERRRAHIRDSTAAKERRSRWEGEVKTAVGKGHSPPDMPADADEPEPPQRRRLLSTEPTVEKAARLVHANPRGLLLVRDELAGWIGGMDRYSRGDGSDRAFWLQAYGGRPWAPDRVKDADRATTIPHLLWGVVGAIQPDRVAGQLLAGDDDGLAARFIYTWPAPIPPRRPCRRPDNSAAGSALAALIGLDWQSPDPVLLPFTEDAAAALQAWREEAANLEDGAAGMFLSWLGKLPGFCLRLAVILEHLEWCWTQYGPPPDRIGVNAVAAAADFLERYAVPMARRVFGEASLPRAERDARAVARWLAKQKPVPDTINERELRRVSGGPGIRETARITAAMEELAEADWLRPAPSRSDGYGRQRQDWAINPAVRDLAR